MEIKLASRLDGVSESATLKLNAMVQTLKAQGQDVVNLTAGEPDYFVVEEAKQAAIEAIKTNQSKYPAVGGIPPLRALIAEKTNLQQPKIEGVWKSENVLVTNGAKQAIYNTMQALLDLGDEVLIFAPYWLSYPDMARLAGGVPKIVETSFESGFKVSPELLEASLTAKTKLIIFNSPSNPTGSVFSESEFQSLGKVLLNNKFIKNIWILSDEIYDKMVYSDAGFCSFLKACPELKNQTITVNGMSKSAAMTGWRVGWSIAPVALTQAMVTLQGQSTSGVNAPAQWASVAALKLPENHFSERHSQLLKKRNSALEILKKAGKIKVGVPEGAFYFFVGIENYFKGSSVEFAERLLTDAKVAVVPGTSFGEDSFVRMSFALEEAALLEGCRRFVKFLESSL